MTKQLEEFKKELIAELEMRQSDKVIEQSKAELLTKLINNADSEMEALTIAEMGTIYRKTGFYYDVRPEKKSDTIKYLKKNENLSFDQGGIHHKLIIGDNYDALRQLLISYKGMIDVIYIDPPYGCNSMGEFADTNYENQITRDNLLSMLEPRLRLAKKLLKEDGVIFVSIDDKNQIFVQCLMDDIFREPCFVFCAPRLVKKGGKTTDTIQKNHDYIICFAKSLNPTFTLDDITDGSYTLKDEYFEDRGYYKLTQTLDYNSLQYSPSLDYQIEIDGKCYIPGGNEKEYEKRQNGEYLSYDWAWRWSKDAVKWGIKNGFIVTKGNRIYTKTYEKCRKKPGSLEIEYKAGKAYSTIEFINDNKYSNDNGKKKLNEIFTNGDRLFKNPKPPALMEKLIEMATDKKDAVVLDFFAGSGSTAQSVLEYNRIHHSNRQFILCTNNEVNEMNPNGIAHDCTSKRLKRIMTGECYDGTNDFEWLKKNTPYGDSLDVYEIGSISDKSATEGKTPFDVINEKDYGLSFKNKDEKIEWICRNFEQTEIYIEEEG